MTDMGDKIVFQVRASLSVFIERVVVLTCSIKLCAIGHVSIVCSLLSMKEDMWIMCTNVMWITYTSVVN